MTNRFIIPLAFISVLSIIARTSVNGFVVPAPYRTITRGISSVSHLEMGGFLDGSQKKNDIMEKEDAAMWVDEDDSGPSWNPFAAKAPKKAAPPPPPTSKGASKPALSFSWQKEAKTPEPEPVIEAPKKESAGFKFPWDK
eukprot:CAMPEP_0195513494 /NCGR_PEP_ID=MMETSP0794_2-20130614/5133_1 /TAXON_ID=515487 /ORGANISM="Stephanopyxis turris, Strain CCMP 815" /LENGTH=139 /DNA_ID=CAMNT_0040641519 /DNA_START=84 /DNA_END=503 /DNA_ORIENTATION=+